LKWAADGENGTRFPQYFQGILGRCPVCPVIFRKENNIRSVFFVRTYPEVSFSFFPVTPPAKPTGQSGQGPPSLRRTVCQHRRGWHRFFYTRAASDFSENIQPFLKRQEFYLARRFIRCHQPYTPETNPLQEIRRVNILRTNKDFLTLFCLWGRTHHPP
jgi:hypothetical protein